MVGKAHIIDVYVHRNLQDKEQKALWLQIECNKSSENAITTCSKSVKENDQSTHTVNSSTTPMLLASGKKVLLQIATVPV